MIVLVSVLVSEWCSLGVGIEYGDEDEDEDEHEDGARLTDEAPLAARARIAQTHGMASGRDPGIARRRVVKLGGPTRTGEAESDDVAVEEPLEIRVGGRSVAVVMRTPGNDRELTAGFLVTEGLIHHRDDVVDMVYCRGGKGEPEENILDVMLASTVSVDFARLTRNVYTSSSP